MILEKINNFILKNILFVIVVLIILYLIMPFNTTSSTPKAPIPYSTESNMSFASDNIQMARPRIASANMYSKGINNDLNSSKIVKNFSLSVEVKDVNNTKTEVENEVNKVNGITDGFYSYIYYGNELAYNFSLRIPSENVESAMNYFKTLGITKSESSSAVDFAEQYSDNQNRLTNLYSRRDRLRKMMDNKTEKLADIIAVDRELNNVQNEIENLENSNKKIDTNVSYSKVELSIIPQVKIEEFNNSKWQVVTAWKNAINDLILFGQHSVNFIFKVAVFIPFILGLLIVFFVIKIIIVKIKK